MAIFNTVWSLDLGSSSLKAVRLRRDKNNVEILAVDKVDYQMGTQGINFSEQSKEALRAFKVRNEVKDPVIVAHSGRGTLSRFLKIPAFDSKKIKEMVKYEASQQIPFPLEEVIWDYHIIQRDYLPGEEREVGIFAARREAIDDYLLEFTGEGLAVEALPLGYLGLLNFFFFDVAPEEPSIVLDMGAGHTDLILVDQRKFWTRTLTQQHSGNEVNKSVMDHFKLTFPEAEKFKLESSKNQKEAVKIFTTIIQPKLRDLVNEIHRSIGFYRSQAGEVQFKQVFLLGNGSKLIGIKKYFEEHLGMPVHKCQSINKVRINREVNLALLQDNLAAFGTAIGCGLQGVGLGSSKVDLVPQEEKIQKEYSRKKKHVFIAMGLLYLAVILAGLQIRGKAKSGDEAMTEARKVLTPIKDADKKIKDITKANTFLNAERLKTVADLRSKPIEGLRLIGEVLSRLPLDKSIRMIAPEEKKDETRAKVIPEADAQLQQKLWVPWLKIERIDWPEETAGGAGGAPRRDAAKKETVPAYKFTLFAVVPMQGNRKESVDLLTKMIEKPLSEKLAAEKFTLDKKVSVSSDFREDLGNIYLEGGTSDSSRARKKDEGESQEGGPFFGTMVHFYARLKDKPQEKAPEPAVSEKPGKPGKPGKTPPSKRTTQTAEVEEEKK
ncbi:MAG: type IV pilus assembly protein PilM [Planctomycetes bacterium]|nr:type IV pilus assembly protein PilM [Planctomycetota bacterium]